VNPEERAAAAARFRARLDQLPEPSETQVSRIAALFAAIRLRITRDHARNSGPSGDNPTPLSHPDHEASNVRPSAPVSGVTGK
jgi:hypothetical protein